MNLLSKTLTTGITILLVACEAPLMISPDAVLPNGSVYQGDIKDGKLHGKGRLRFTSGDEYVGEFHNGLMQGQGVYTYADGSRYEGAFVNGAFEGQGTYTRSGGTYVGEFRNNLYHGQGKYTFEDTVYQGNFVDGNLSGEGSYTSYQGRHYVGEVDNWVASGNGTLTDEEGNVITGKFANGYVDGIAEIQGADGSHYKGEVEYGEPDGSGVITYADGSVYDGEFSYGNYHGTGTLTTPAKDGTEAIILSGKWRNGRLIYNAKTGVDLDSQAELALEHHQTLLESRLQSLAPGKDGEIDVYYLGIAGDGSQSVFRRELEYVTEVVNQRYQNQDTSIALINHHDSAQTYPLATTRSIRAAIDAIGTKMNPEEDILFAYLSSHGSKEFEFSLKHNGIRLPDLSAETLAGFLQESPIKWKVLIISACYSGGFIAPLSDEYTMVITAADSASRSFGCSEESEMTHFGKALFKEVLSKNPSMPMPQAFAKAKQLIAQWEKDDDREPSNPSISSPRAVVEHLSAASGQPQIGSGPRRLNAQ